MDFGSALQHLRIGARLRRKNWAGMFIYLVAGSEFEATRAPLLGILKEGTKVRYRAHIDYRAFDGSFGVYDFKQEDVLADDWEFVDDQLYGDDVVDEHEFEIEPAPGHEFGVEHVDEHTHDDHRDHGGTPHDDNEADLAARAAREEEADRIATINNFHKTL